MGLARASPKARLPDAHNDFVFAAIAEETGIAACLFLILIYALIVWRVLRRAFREEDAFVRLAAAGLVMIFGLQALINMAVNLNLLPAKGVTLPFISYGRSSLIASAITLGMVAGLTRRPASRLASHALQPLGGLTVTSGEGGPAMSRGSIMLSAGGTGGHLFPAQALGDELIKRGWDIDLITDTRGNMFGSEFKAPHDLQGAGRDLQGPLADRGDGHARHARQRLSGVVPHHGRGCAQGNYRFWRLSDACAAARGDRPRHPVGDPRAEFGDGPGQPLSRPHGEGHRLLVRKYQISRRQASRQGPAHRHAAARRRSTRFATFPTVRRRAWTQLNLLVFGGSQGAKYFSDIVPQALQMLPAGMRDRLFVMQQCREEDIDRVFDAYEVGGRGGGAGDLLRGSAQ